MVYNGLLHLQSRLILNNLSSSFLRVSSWIFAIGTGLWCLCTAPSFKFRCAGFVWNSPKVPSNKSSNCCKNFRISWHLSLDKWQQCFFTTLTRLAFSCDVSKLQEPLSGHRSYFPKCLFRKILHKLIVEWTILQVTNHINKKNYLCFSDWLILFYTLNFYTNHQTKREHTRSDTHVKTSVSIKIYVVGIIQANKTID